MKTIKKIGPYEIIREIGRGGMGVVYLAKHPTLGIDVALKAMFPDPSRPKDDPVMIKAQERFKKEAEICAKLNDPHIVTIYDCGVDDDTGIFFIAMKYLDGGSLKDLIKQKGQFTLEETLEIIQPIAKALEYVHELGIIHRDLKPGNIIFLRDNPVITDFGIAKNVKDTINTITDETGRLVGSIPYMSPERIDEKPFDHRADIYALGVLSYEMLTGTNPFAANTHTGAMKKVTTYQPPLISNEVPNIPREFANLLNNLINKESNRRPENLRELIEFDLLKIQITQIREQFEKERQRENTDRKRRERDEKARTRNQENTNVEWVIKEREIDAKRLYEIERKKQLAEESVQKESKKKGTFTLVIVIVVVLIFALSIFVFGTNKDNSETALEKLLDGYSLISESGENPNKSLALDAFYVFDDAQRKATETLLDEPSNNLAKVILIWLFNKSCG